VQPLAAAFATSQLAGWSVVLTLISDEGAFKLAQVVAGSAAFDCNQTIRLFSGSIH